MFETFTNSDWLQFYGIVSASLLSVIAILISLFTLWQNHKMIESSSRPSFAIYGSSINPGNPMLYLVVKNCGNSSAVITKFNYDQDLTKCYCFNADKDFLKDLIGANFPPNTSKICRLDYQKVPEYITFDIAYKSSSKTYKETIKVNIKAGAALPITRMATKDKELRTISYTLQDMLEKLL